MLKHKIGPKIKLKHFDLELTKKGNTGSQNKNENSLMTDYTRRKIKSEINLKDRTCLYLLVDTLILKSS